MNPEFPAMVADAAGRGYRVLIFAQCHAADDEACERFVGN